MISYKQTLVPDAIIVALYETFFTVLYVIDVVSIQTEMEQYLYNLSFSFYDYVSTYIIHQKICQLH